MKEILLSQQGKNKDKYVALVDDEDYERLNQFRWCANFQHNSRYAVRTVCVNGKKNNITMHREILGDNGDLFIDHRDNDSLNCQKYNMRHCTLQQNLMNQRPKKHGNSIYKGVSWNKSHGVFVAKIIINGKNTYVKQSSNEIEAAKAYDEAAKIQFGEFAYLNFP